MNSENTILNSKVRQFLIINSLNLIAISKFRRYKLSNITTNVAKRALKSICFIGGIFYGAGARKYVLQRTTRVIYKVSYNKIKS